MPVSSSTEHWIKPDALTINLNHFGDPDYLQVSVLAGAVVMAFKQDVIGYNAAHNYRTWPIEAANTYLETSSAYNVYARLTRSEVNARALIAYDTVLRDIEGREITYAEDGSEVLGDASVDYFFVFLGQISESTDRNGGKKERSWNIGFRFGALNTTEQKNYTGFLFEKMFRPHYDDSLNPDKITSIEVLSGLWTRFFISAKGISPNNGGESGSGLIRQVFGYNDLSGNFLNSDLNNTFNAYTIARLSARITALEQNGGGSGGGGVADSIEWEKVLYKPSWLVDKKPSVSFFENDAQYITSDALNPYATQQWVNDKGYAIATDVANTYVAKTTFNTLKTDFDNLSALLNDDVQGKINTWYEVVDFLDEYSGSQDLAAILSGMNTDIASRVEKSKFAEYFNSEMAKWFVKDDANKGIKPVNSYGLYSDTYVSAKGVSTGTGGSGCGSSYDRLDKWSDYTTDKAGWVLSALLGQDLNNRLSSLESGSALSLVTTGDGNAVTAIAKSGNQLTVTKGSTFQSLITSSNKLAYSLISGTPTSLPASDVAAWAKAASKPSYAFSEITNKPTTLSGYGITDAYTSSVIDGKLSGYLPSSGGTISGDLILDSTTYIRWLQFQTGSGAGYIGYSSSADNWYLTNKNWLNEYIIIHSGNIGSQSVSKANFLARQATLTTDTIDSFLSTDGIQFSLISSYAAPGWVGNDGMIISVPWTNLTYGAQIAIDDQSNYVALRAKSNGVWKDWRVFAFTDSNVASATKLQTPRTIWGQSFDGTGDVSGKLTGVTQIQNAENKGIYLWSNTYSSNYPTNSGNLGTGVGIGVSPSYGTFIWGTGNGNGHIQVGRSDGTNTSYNLLLQEFGGNVGIGTTSPKYKLDVDGAFRASSSSYFGYSGACEVYLQRSNGFSYITAYSSLALCTGGSSGGIAFTLGTDYTAHFAGKVGIGTTSPTEKLHVDGNIVATGGITGSYFSAQHASNPYIQLIEGSNIYYLQAYGGALHFGPTLVKSLSVDREGNVSTRGNIVATGSVTAKSSSDYRLKCGFDYNVDYQERLLSLGKVCDFNYTPHAQKREFAFADDKRHTSVIWQDARKANITGFCSVEEDGYGTINPLSSDLIFTIVGAIQQGIVKTERIEERVVRLEKENRELKEKINLLEGGRYGC